MELPGRKFSGSSHNQLKSPVSAFRKTEFLIPVLLFLLNLVIKSFGISAISFDLDEAYHSHFSLKTIAGILQTSATDPNGPVYNLLLHFWMPVAGVSEFSLRFLSVILSALTAPLIYTFAKKYFNPEAGIFSALLFTASSIHFYYSHNARVYALLCFLTIISFHLFFRLIQNKRWTAFFWLIIINTLLIYTHPTTIFVFAAEFFSCFFFFHQYRRGVMFSIGALVIPVVLFIPWVLTSPYFTSHAPSTWMQPPGWVDFKETLIFLFGNIKFLIGFILLFILTALLFLLKKIPRQMLFPYSSVLLLFIVPVLFNFLISVNIVPILLAKYVLTATLGIMLVAGFSISVLPVPAFIRYIVFAALAYISAMEIGKNPFGIEQWREVAHDIRSQKTDRTMVMISPGFQYVSFAFYYSPAFFKNADSTEILLRSEKIIPVDNTLRSIFEQPTDYDTLIFLTSHEHVVNPQELVAYMKNNFILYSDSAYGGIRMYSFRKKSPVAHFICDMESGSQSFQLHRIDEKALTHSGKKVNVLDAEHAYGTTFQDRVGAFNMRGAHVNFCGWVFTGEKNSDDILVISIEHNSKTYLYQAMDVSEQATPGQWSRVCQEIRVPENALSTDTVKFYFWNKGNKPIFVDDMEVTELK